jgi:ABC-2 type transport system permease protein
MQPDVVLPRVTGRVARKELTLFFASPVAWLFLISFAAVTLFTFFWGSSFFARNVADVRPLFEWLPILLIFLCSAMTMRMWSEERRTGTLEHVLTQPQPLWQFVLGKFQACLALLAIALAVTLPLPITVALLANLDWGPVLAAYLATLLLGASYLAIGLFVSARSDNPIVALIGSVALCTLLYLPGTALITGFFSTATGEWLRLLGSGARFESIARGVVDLRDLAYYLSLTAIFLTLNIYSLQRQRWVSNGAEHHAARHHRLWALVTLLVVANSVALNLWLHRINAARVDVTQGSIYSISDATRQYLSQLQEPLLIRGYFSAQTHPLLAPLVPQLRDLIREYGVAGGDKVRIEFVDPVEDPALEQEANEKYGIRATPFQVADRYSAAVVNSYFDVLIRYGDQHKTLGFADLIEVKADANGNPDVRLRNPEFDITRSLRQVLYAYQAGGDLFASIDGEITLTGYVSADDKLPGLLQRYRREIQPAIDEWIEKSGARLRVEFLEPEANDGAVAKQIREEWGFKPMLASLFDDREFWFYLTLSDDRQVVQLPTEGFDPEQFKGMLEAGIKRFAKGFTRTVAVVTPKPDPELARFGVGGLQFSSLEQTVTDNHSIRLADLSEGRVDSDAEVLMLAAPENLNERALFAVDQFLMRGGTVVIATSPWGVQFGGRTMSLQPRNSGLEDWLAHHGITLSEEVVMDSRNAAFPVPVTRSAGGFQFQDVQLVDYPYFIDVRDEGLSQHPLVRSLPQVTLTWAAPITVDADKTAERSVETLLSSSDKAWLGSAGDILPRATTPGAATWAPGTERDRYDLAVLQSGRFTSFFADKPSPLLTDAAVAEVDAMQDEASAEPSAAGGVITRSADSARLLVISSNDFLSDQILGASSSASGTQYLGPLQLVANTLDWALEDASLAGMRAVAHFNRTLPPLGRGEQRFWEIANYVAAAVLLLALWALRRHLRQRRDRFYRDSFGFNRLGNEGGLN